jgi:predicted TIM-barrel fold metal-dependent hydrolase
VIHAQIIDAHVHVVDPARYPVPDGPGYKPGSDDIGTAEELKATLGRHGVEAAIVVQLSGYGTDNRCVLDAVARSGGRWRAIVALEPGASGRELDRLTAAGAVGARFNIANLGEAALAGGARLFEALAERGWVAQVQCPAKLLPELPPWLARAPGPLLFDHLGLPEVARGVEEPGFQRLLTFGREGAFIKLSGAFRLSHEPYPHADLQPFVAALCEAFPPERRVWGSDWPFVATGRRPAYSETLALLDRWLPEPRGREFALRDVPRRLFGLGPS